jgi:hypothetical protein
VPETGDALHAFHAPGLHLLERPHEHLVATKRVRAVLRDDIKRVDDVAPPLRHLATVFAEDHPLVHESLERLRFGEMPEIEEHLVPEARVKQMQHSVLGTADVKVHASRLAAAHPVALGLGADESIGIAWVAKPQVVPA